jgi:hypothetical protein
MKSTRSPPRVRSVSAGVLRKRPWFSGNDVLGTEKQKTK